MRARTYLVLILVLTSPLLACSLSGTPAGASQTSSPAPMASPASTSAEASAPTATPPPAPTDTEVPPSPTPTPAECQVVAQANATVYERPSLSAPVFGTLSSGDSALVGAWTTDGWLGFDPGVAQAANMGVFRLRWVENTSSIRLDGPCSKVPVETWIPTVGVCYDMPMEDTAVHYLATTGSVVLVTLKTGEFAAVTGMTTTGFARVDLNRGFPQRPIKGWVQSSDLNMNGPCDSLPTVKPSAH
ncbi:MAG: hypothetical protein ABSF61_11175 [Anaerolineales bacterium]